GPNLLGLIPFVDEDIARDTLGSQPRPGADSIDLALEAPLEAVAGADVEQLELDAGAAGVDDEDRSGHLPTLPQLRAPAGARERRAPRRRRKPSGFAHCRRGRSGRSARA